MAVINNPYLDNAYQNKLDALTKQYEANLAQSAYQNQMAKATQKETNRLSANNYMTAINRYGIQAEQRAMNGLNNSGVLNRANTNAYTNLQNNYANATKTYLGTISENNNNLLRAQYQNEADKLNAMGEYNTNLYNEYMRQVSDEYQRQRDKVADKQWERDYKLRKKQMSL